MRAGQSISARDAIFLVVRALFEDVLAENSKILVVGAYGEEILTLGLLNHGWQLAGVDLTESMLKLAETRFAQAQLTNNVQLHRIDVRRFEESKFDAVDPFFDATLCPG